jgi:flagellar protein FlaG
MEVVMEISSLPTDLNKVAVVSTPAVETEDRVKPQVAPVQENLESSASALNDRALHGRDSEEEKRRLAAGATMSREELEKVVAEVQKRLEAIGSNLSLGLAENKETESIVAQIRDKSSDKIIKQFPSEEVLKLRAKLADLMGILFEGKA